MTAKNVEWVLVIRYQLSHHKAIYGRLTGQDIKDDSFSKDFIQLSRRQSFLSDIEALFGANKKDGATALRYKWPLGHEALGSLVFKSSDRPHLSWETNRAPAPWRMAEQPAANGIETIPGEPGHQERHLASAQFSLISSRGGGQPFLVAVKLQGEVDTLHLRVYLAGADKKYEWASTDLLPLEVQDILSNTRPNNTIAWLRISGEEGPELTFDPQNNHDAWRPKLTESGPGDKSTESSMVLRDASVTDATAELLPISEAEVEKFSTQIRDEDYEVDDTQSTTKTRGSAQRAFSDRVKKNYKGCCAITGIRTRSFLVAAHIVPWSQDKSIRLDPSNGICLSALVDKAFELGYIVVADDLTISVNWDLIGSDSELGAALGAYDGKKLFSPPQDPPKPEYLKRRRDLLKVQ